MSGATGNKAVQNDDVVMKESAAQNPQPITLGMVLFSINQLHRVLRAYIDDNNFKFESMNERLDSLNQTMLDFGVQLNGVEDKITKNAVAFCPNCHATPAGVEVPLDARSTPLSITICCNRRS